MYFKHSLMANGQNVAMWVSDNSDPSLTNPYPDVVGSFITEKVNDSIVRLMGGRFRKIDGTSASIDAADNQAAATIAQRKAQLQAILSATPGTLTNVQRDAILQHLIKTFLGL